MDDAQIRMSHEFKPLFKDYLADLHLLYEGHEMNENDLIQSVNCLFKAGVDLSEYD